MTRQIVCVFAKRVIVVVGVVFSPLVSPIFSSYVYVATDRLTVSIVTAPEILLTSTTARGDAKPSHSSSHRLDHVIVFYSIQFHSIFLFSRPPHADVLFSVAKSNEIGVQGRRRIARVLCGEYSLKLREIVES